MRKISLFMMVSLDGYFEGVDHELDWHNVDAEFNAFAVNQLDAADCLLFGHKTYDLMASYWPTENVVQDDPAVADRMNSMKKIVFSTTLQKADWNNTAVIGDHIPAAMQELKEQSGKDILMLGSNNLAVSFVKMGLLDEVRIIINPVAIGKGHALFTGLEERFHLQLVKQHVFKSGNVLLTYSKK